MQLLEIFIDSAGEEYNLLIFTDLLILVLALFTPLIRRIRTKNKLLWKILTGLSIGAIGSFAVLSSTGNIQSIYYDSHYLLVIVSFLYYSPLSAVIGTGISIITSVIISDTLMWLEVVILLISATIAFLYSRYIYPRVKKLNFLYIGGVTILTHAIILLLLLIPDITRPYVRELSVYYFAIFPFSTAFVVFVADKQLSYFSILDQEIYRKTVFDAAMNAFDTIEIYFVDTNNKYLEFNNVHSETVYASKGIRIKIGDSLANSFALDENRDIVLAANKRALNGEKIILSDKQGDKMVQLNISAFHNNDNKISGVSTIIYNTTEFIEREQKITHLSQHDTLTQLYNRYYYDRKLEEFVLTKTPFALIFFDVNGLKTINDTLGHLMGDELLITTGNKISEKFSSQGFVARLGGDEFAAVVTPSPVREKVLSDSEEVKKALLNYDFHDFSISVSYGIAYNDGTQKLSETFKEAEYKMYHYKSYESSSLHNKNIKTIISILAARKSHDPERASRLKVHVTKIGEKLNLSLYEINLLALICELHDIGNVSVDESILCKKTKLTEEEVSIIRRHPEIGYKILASTPTYTEIANDVYSHHERYDGTGYPNKVAGENILLRARIFSVVDAYDAMINDRPYRKALSKEKAIAELKKNRGTQFDPKIVDIFIETLQ